MTGWDLGPGVVELPVDDAVAWVRSRYHPRAAETRQQRRWVGAAARRLHG